MEEYQYLNLVTEVLEQPPHEGRNGPVRSLFGPQHTFDLQNGFPLLTTKKMYTRAIIEELLFFLKGKTQTKELEEKKIYIWSENTSRKFLNSRGLNYSEGEMGPMYGYNWRHFGSSFLQNKNEGVDQLKNLIDGLINDPYSRRHLLTTYDPSSVDECVLAPCHGLITQFYVSSYFSHPFLLKAKKEEAKKELHCKTYQRSADLALGYPFNITSYALLLKIIAKACGYKAGKLIITLGDVHIYEEHVEGLQEQLKRECFPFPKLKIAKKKETGLEFIESLTYEDFKVINYQSHSFIKFLMKA
jgi:thymidylate synthase